MNAVTQQRTAGEAIIDAVVANGTETVFGIPGAQIYPLFDGIYKSPLRLVVPRHEQAAAYMAMGYAKSTGKTGVFSVVPGPGILNTSAALCTAMSNCSPIVGLTGQIPSSFLGKGRGHLHELKDQTGTLKTLIKDAIHIGNPADISSEVNRAFQLARSGRPGPVTVEMCWDTMAGGSDSQQAVSPLTATVPDVDPAEIRAAAALIRQARKPMILCGSGAQHAADEVLALAERITAPVGGFRSGRGIVPEDHPLGVPPVAARQLWDEVDLLIGIGSRLEMPYLNWANKFMQYEQKPSGGPKLLRIDIDPAQMDIFQPDQAVVADSAQACRLILEQLEIAAEPDHKRLDDIATAKAVAWQAIQKVQPQLSYLNVIRQVLPRDGIYVPEVSQMGFATWIGGFPVLQPRSFIEGGYQGNLGYGFATALGAKVANPDRPVVSVCGDGGFMFGAQELITAAEHNIALVTLVFNNSTYTNVRRDQLLGYGGRFSGSEITSPDFVRMAESCGVQAWRVDSPAALKPVLEKALAADRPVLIEVMSERGSEASPWEFIHMHQRLGHPAAQR